MQAEGYLGCLEQEQEKEQAGGEEQQQQAGGGEEEHNRMHEFKHNFEKLNGFKMKGMWAGTGAAGAGGRRRSRQEGRSSSSR